MEKYPFSVPLGSIGWDGDGSNGTTCDALDPVRPDVDKCQQFRVRYHPKGYTLCIATTAPLAYRFG